MTNSYLELSCALIFFSSFSRRFLSSSHSRTLSKAIVSSPTTSCSTCSIDIWEGIFKRPLKKINSINMFVCKYHLFIKDGLVWFMVLNTTFNNISVTSWRSILLVEETGVPGENYRPLSHNVVLSSGNRYVYWLLG